MAFQTQITCGICKKDVTVAVISGGITPRICSECRRAGKDAEKIQYFEELDKFSIEERLRKVELWIYNYSSPKKIGVIRGFNNE
jgi:hypothetical protein